MTRSLELGKLQGATIVQRIVEIQQNLVELWHHQPIEVQGTGILEKVARQHSFNFLLWHEEDIARSETASDSEIATVKRNIDKLNQSRNDHIEMLDDWFVDQLRLLDSKSDSSIRINTETPGSAIDRLSIMALRIFHLHEQLQRSGVSSGHSQRVQEMLKRCQLQHTQLTKSLGELIDDLVEGNRRLEVFRAFKLYNDPTMNPVLYKSTSKDPQTDN